MQWLATQGLTVKPFELEGRFHSPLLENAVAKISDFCNSNRGLQLPRAKQLLVPLRTPVSADVISDGSLHEIALRSIMTEIANWHLTMSSAICSLNHSDSHMAVSLGLVDSIPASVVRESGLKVTKLGDFELSSTTFARSESVPDKIKMPLLSSPQGKQYPDQAIAIVGMACKFPGADSVDEFWQVINSGASMCQEVPSERFSTQRLRRTPEQSRYWGNFIRDVDAFDHRFFKRSNREAASMDPQQRLLLQVAYEAMESSGYFGEFTTVPDDVGCYLGVCATDYDDNISSHNPTAFSSVGQLRAFLSGRISHQFGWTGPSITYDTACSSSAVAIDAACKAINLGDCSTAIAGGASIFTSPYFFQNLAAASFLSPTGATKPFDAEADGYCRGEGIGLIVLRKLCTAIAKGDNILAVIAATAVNQNSNRVPITVPHSPSQIKLFRKIIAQAGIRPTDVSFVEAHGTGTPVGDPLEIESIREVFGGSERLRLLHLSSVKGNIGHAEGASGVAALIKTVLMMQHETIPVQANFTSLNPKIAPLEADKIAIPLTSQNWDVENKVACINNYGAAGSNASIIVCQPPLVSSGINCQKAPLPRYPISLSANSFASLSAYCAALQTYIARLAPVSDSPEALLENLAFNLAQKHNRSFPHTFTTTAANLSDFNDQLAVIASGVGQSQFQMPAAPCVKPLVLVFGGQTSQAIGLSREFYNASTLFRSYIDTCDAITRSLGHEGLYPDIFQDEPVKNIVSLHSMLFSLQYSCAQAWMDSGLQVDAIIGHSFGQLTALCVSGSLSLEDGLKLVLGRASLMRSHWGLEKGAMISLEADLEVVQRIISLVGTRDSDHKLEIACYNGPTSHVLVGAESAIKAFEEALPLMVAVKYKILNVTHGFHSELTDPLLPALIDLAKDLTFMEPKIPLETCSDGQSWTEIVPEMIAEHTRAPVYFGQAVERLALRLGPCTWLEAGSSSSIIGVLRRSLGKVTSSQHAFHALSLSSTSAIGSLADTTVTLRKDGHKVQFWPFHRCQKSEYSQLNLPPYQFEKARHWIEWVPKAQELPKEVKAQGIPKEDSKPVLLSFVRFQDQSQRDGEFFVDPRSEQYRLFVQGHGVLGRPLCPASLYIEVVCQAALFLRSTSEMSTSIPCVDELEMIAPIGYDSDLAIGLSLRSMDAAIATWDFVLTSWSLMNPSNKTNNVQQHATGRVSLQEPDSRVLNDTLLRFQRLVGYHRYEDLVANPKAEGIQGSLIYKVFNRVVQYADYYKGVKLVFAREHEVAGRVELTHHVLDSLNDTVCNPLAIDNFMQVAGLHVNSLNDCNDDEVFMSTKVDRIQIGSRYRPFDTGSWSVYSSFSPNCEKEIRNDIFVFDSATKSLVVMILGARFTKVRITSLTKVLSRSKSTQSQAEAKVNVTSAASNILPNSLRISAVQPGNSATNILDSRCGADPMEGGNVTPPEKTSPGYVMSVLKKILGKITEVPIESLSDDYTLVGLGIDSLLMIEVAAEIRQAFGGNMHAPDFENVPDIKSLSSHVWSNLSENSTLNSKSLTGSSTTVDLSKSTPTSTAIRNTFLGDLPLLEDHRVSQLVKLLADFLETHVPITSDTCLTDLGLDSLLSIELASDIETSFAVKIDITQLNNESTFGDLCDMVLGAVQDQSTVDKIASRSTISTTNRPISHSNPSKLAIPGSSSLVGIQQAFEQVRRDYDLFAKATGKVGFWKEIYPTQARLVVAYVVEAFASLGCSLASLRPGERLSQVSVLPKHNLLVGQLYTILKAASLILSNGFDLVRSERMLESAPASKIYEDLLQAFPQYASQHRLLHITGSKLAECLTGAVDPLQLLFLSKENKGLMEDVYINEPMCAVITELLCSFLDRAFSICNSGRKFNILEVGGGTGGTTKHIVDFLQHREISFTYTFTDIAPSLVAAARKKFAECDFMDFMILDIEKTPPERIINQYDTIISVNCIHATSNLKASSKNLRQMLRSDGFLSLVEFTTNIFWFDLVYGLLKGWWLFNDGRKHALADEMFWADSMKAAGFKHISWTDGTSLEARTIRIITGFPAEPESPALIPSSAQRQRKAHMETLVYQQTHGVILCADIYYPAASELSQAKLPVGTLSLDQTP